MKSKILFVLILFFGLMMINAGLNKFFHYMPMPEPSEAELAVFGAFGTLRWVLPLVATIEIIGGILIAIPRYRALGAVIILPVTVGIVVHHMVHDPAGIGLGLVMFAINIWVIAEHKDKYLPMIKA